MSNSCVQEWCWAMGGPCSGLQVNLTQDCCGRHLLLGVLLSRSLSLELELLQLFLFFLSFCPDLLFCFFFHLLFLSFLLQLSLHPIVRRWTAKELAGWQKISEWTNLINIKQDAWFDHEGMTALHYCCMMSFFKTLCANYEALVQDPK